ncbi:MAG: hypothetical protein GX445_07750 [Elusimicrobia bacterium]|nr:hypothetical protein [Elusimicrobiota bacterium]
MITVKNKNEFLSLFPNYRLFEVKDVPLSDKRKFISALAQVLNLPTYVLNWDGLIDEMRGLYKVDAEKIIIIFYTDPEKNQFLSDLSEVVETVNEFLKDFNREIILAVSEIK